MTRFTPETMNPHGFPIHSDQLANLADTANKCNEFLDAYPYDVPMNSGFRNFALQMQVNPLAPMSNHLTGKALDGGELLDNPNRLMEYILSNLDRAQALGLFFENFNWVPTWCHIQTVPPKSGHRIFIPDSSPAKCARWSGNYDRKYDLNFS